MSERALQSVDQRDSKLRQAEQVLAEILERMEWQAKLELKDAEDGGISVALHPEQELPGVQAGKRSIVVDSLQLMVNKIVNRQPSGRRWIAIGIGGHPPPRPDRTPKKSTTSTPPATGVVAARAAPREVSAVPSETDERSLQVTADPALAATVQQLAERSAALGRFYAIFGMGKEERAQVVQTLAGSHGCVVSIEGEGRQRRVLFTPAKPTAMPKRMFPLDDDEDELGDNA
jgi:predicted RNA-binding protein Jag